MSKKPAYRQFVVMSERVLKEDYYCSITNDIEMAIKWAKKDMEKTGESQVVMLIVAQTD